MAATVSRGTIRTEGVTVVVAQLCVNCEPLCMNDTVATVTGQSVTQDNIYLAIIYTSKEIYTYAK